MSMEMSNEQVQTFLDRAWPTMLGVIGTLLNDGSPHVVPVWYRYDGENINIWSGEERGWVKNIKLDNRVAFSVQEVQPPYAAIVIHGKTEFVTNHEEISEEIRKITQRYIPEQDVDDYIKRWQHLRVIVRITPETVYSWNRGY